jgi:hypothetical protein
MTKSRIFTCLKLYAIYEPGPGMVDEVFKRARCKQAENILGWGTGENCQDRCPTILGVCRMHWKHEALCSPKQMMPV